MQNCESFYLVEGSKKYENLSKYMDGMVNDVSFLTMSDVGILLKTLSLENEYKDYDKHNYFEEHLPKILQQEQNKLFQKVYELILNCYKNQQQEDESVFEKIFIEYKDAELQSSLQRFEVMNDFIEIIYLGGDCPRNIVKPKKEKAFWELSDDEFSSLLWFYAKKMRIEGVMAIEPDIEKEHSYFRAYFMLMVDGHSPDDIVEFLDKEKQHFKSELDKKIDIAKFGLLKYLKSLNMIKTQKNEFEIENQLKSFFDRVIVDELFKYAKNRIDDSKDTAQATQTEEKQSEEKKDEKILSIKTDGEVYDIYEFDNNSIVVVEKNLFSVYSEEGSKIESFHYDESIEFDKNKISFMLNGSVNIIDETLKVVN